MIDGNELDDGLTEDDVPYDTFVPDMPSFLLPRHNLQGTANKKWAEAVNKTVIEQVRENRILKSQLKAYGQLQTELSAVVTQQTADFTVEADVPPPKTSAPVLESRLGNLAVTWDGTDYRGGPMPSDFARLEVYVFPTADIPEGADFNFRTNPLEVVEPVSEESDGDAPNSDEEVVEEIPDAEPAPDDSEYPEQDNSKPVAWPPLHAGTINFPGAGGILVLSDLKYNVDYTVWFIAVDRGGNVSEASDRSSQSVVPIVDTDLIGRIIDQANIELGAIDKELLNPEVKAEIDKALTDAEAAVEGIEGAVNNAAEAKADAVRAANDAANALEKAVESLTTANNVDAKATQAQSDAAAAQTAADQARADAQEAADRALEAAGLVAGKGQIIYQETEPTGDLRNTSNLWIKTSTGKPHTFDGTDWVPIVDQDVIDGMMLALTEAGAASTAANVAQARADEAHTLAGSASSAAAQAQATASAKNQTFRSTSAASGTASNGDTWEQWDSLGSGGKLKAFWRHNGSSWVKGTLDETYLPLVNIGQGTYGELNGNRLIANSVMASTIGVGDFTNLATIDPVRDINVTRPAAWTTQTRDGYITRGTGSDNYIMFKDRTDTVPFGAGDQIRVSFRAKASVASNVGLRLWGYPEPWNGSNSGLISASGPAFTVGTTEELFTGVFTIPAGFNETTQLKSWIAGLYPGTGVDMNNVGVRDVQMRRMNSGALIVDGAIQSNHIQTNSVTADKVLMDQAFASQMYANRILVGPDDFAPGPGGYENAWSLTRAAFQNNNNDASGVCIRFNAGSSNGAARGPRLPVRPDAEYYLQCNVSWYVSATTGGDFSLQMEWYNSAGSVVSTSEAASFVDGSAGRMISGTVTAPSTARTACVRLYVSGQSGSGDRAILNVIARPKTGGELIVDGAITTRTLAADAVTADKIVANAITTPKIAANSIIGDHIVGNSITGNKIQGNTITGDKIQGNTISGDKIMANAITTSKIAAGAITADKIDALALSVTNLEVGRLVDDFAPPFVSGGVWNAGTTSRTTVSYGTEDGDRYIQLNASGTGTAVPTGLRGLVPAPANVSNSGGTIFNVTFQTKFLAGYVPSAGAYMRVMLTFNYSDGTSYSPTTFTYFQENATEYSTIYRTIPVRKTFGLQSVDVWIQPTTFSPLWRFRVRRLTITRAAEPTFLDRETVSSQQVNGLVGTFVDVLSDNVVEARVQLSSLGTIHSDGLIYSRSSIRANTMIQGMNSIGVWDGVSSQLAPSFISLGASEMSALKSVASQHSSDEVFTMNPSVGSGRIVITRSGRTVEIVFEVTATFGTSGHVQIGTIPERFRPPSLLTAASERRSGGAWFTGTQYGSVALFTDGRLFVANTTGTTQSSVNGSLPYFV